jgi:hypothetical protein
MTDPITFTPSARLVIQTPDVTTAALVLAAGLVLYGLLRFFAAAIQQR